MNNRPLEGINVTDFGWIYAVPHATAWLGALGADVIRIETAGRPDLIRAMGLTRGADGIPGINRSGGFNGINYSKRGVTLNLADPRGLDLAKRLVERSDIVTENFAVGVIERLGLGYDVLKEIRPELIMLSGSPLGQTGPERLATGWGPTTLAYTGLPYATGYRDGPPSGFGGAYPDFMIGVQMTFALLVALHERNRTGRGQHIDVSIGETVAAMNPEPVIDFAMNGREVQRDGNRHPQMAPHGVYPCSGDDRWVAISVEDDEQWRAMRGAMGDPPWAAGERFDTLAGRFAQQDELDEGVSGWTREHDHYEVMHLLQAVGVPAAPSLDAEGLATDPQLAARGFFVEIDHAELGPRVVPGLPGRFSAMPSFDYRPTPLLGEHNEEVFCGLLGLPRDEFDRLVEEQVIA